MFFVCTYVERIDTCVYCIMFFVCTYVERIDKLHPFLFFVPHDENDESDFKTESTQ